MRKKLLTIAILAGVAILLYIGFSPKKINQIGNINYNNITKIQFIDGSRRNKPLAIEDMQKIKEFMDYTNSCIVIRWFEPAAPGWERMVEFYQDDKKVMSITFSNPIDINGYPYRTIWGGLSIEEIDKFIQSVDPYWTA